MNFNPHYDLRDRHAFLGPSKSSWLRYDIETLEKAYFNAKAKERGTRLHAYASESIKLGIKLPKSHKTLNMFVNDAIGFKMASEQPLYYSDNCFGTADAISFRANKLRIHDLKTGVTPAHMEQLEIYAALFCMEYGVSPSDISIELRIYQMDDILVHNPEPEAIFEIMDKIVDFDKRIDKLRSEE